MVRAKKSGCHTGTPSVPSDNTPRTASKAPAKNGESADTHSAGAGAVALARRAPPPTTAAVAFAVAEGNAARVDASAAAAAAVDDARGVAPAQKASIADENALTGEAHASTISCRMSSMPAAPPPSGVDEDDDDDDEHEDEEDDDDAASEEAPLAVTAATADPELSAAAAVGGTLKHGNSARAMAGRANSAMMSENFASWLAACTSCVCGLGVVSASARR